jgi:putative PIN family toxin of toxin-antitoxin system
LNNAASRSGYQRCRQRRYFPTGRPRQILESWHRQKFIVLTSAAIISEVSRVLRYPHLQERYRLTEIDVQTVLDSLLNDAYLLEDAHQVRRSRDPADDIFLACALEGKADYLVSSDAHLLEIKYYHGTQIVSPGQFLEVLDKL